MSLYLILFKLFAIEMMVGPEVGACCLPNGNCLELPSQELCMRITEAQWAGQGTTCSDADGHGVADACEIKNPAIVWWQGGGYSCSTGCSGGSSGSQFFLTEYSGVTWRTPNNMNPAHSFVFFDVLSDRFIWESFERIFSANRDGSDIRILYDARPNDGGSISGLSVVNRRVYWYEYQSTPEQSYGLKSMNLDDSIVHDEYIDFPSSEFTIALPPLRAPFADADFDGDIDLRDFAIIQNSFTGPR